MAIKHKINCDHCNAAMIQGVFCHESGCPNYCSRFDIESGRWIKQRRCFECGYDCDRDDPCCNEPIEDYEN